MEVEQKPADAVQPVEGQPLRHDLLVQSPVQCVLVVQHVAGAEVDRVVPGQEAEMVVEQLVQPPGLERSAMAELVHGGLHADEAAKQAVQVECGGHRDPHPVQEEEQRKREGPREDQQKTPGLQQPARVAALGEPAHGLMSRLLRVEGK